MYLSTQLLTIALAAVAQAAPAPAVRRSVETRVSPDGYRYTVEDAPYIPRLFTAPDGSTRTVKLHPDLAEAMPDVGTSPNPALVKRLEWMEPGRPFDFCSNTYFVNKSSEGSPSVGACAAIRDYYRANGGWFRAKQGFDLTSDWTRLVITDDCVFAIRSDARCYAKIGNTDISDLVGDSINRFQWNGRVGAEGRMSCEQECTGIAANTQWAVFHS